MDEVAADTVAIIAKRVPADKRSLSMTDRLEDLNIDSFSAVEMIYDNYNWLVIGFSPTDRPSDAIFSLVLPPGRVTLCFLQGAGLPDPGMESLAHRSNAGIANRIKIQSWAEAHGDTA